MKPKHDLPVYILCGGKSTRMQTDKGLVHYNGKLFIQWIIDAVKPLSDSIYLVTSNTDYKGFGYPLIDDIYKEKGPVGGIYSALKHTQSDRIMVLSCDIPTLTTQVLEAHLLNEQANDGTEILMLANNEKIYPLVGIYSKSVTDGFEDAINSDKLKLILVIKDFTFKTIQVDKSHRNALVNINTKQELEVLKNSSNPIRVNLKYFGEIAESTNCHEEQLVLDSDNFSKLMANLNQKYALEHHDIIVAINQERIDNYEDITLQTNDEIAILPPFAGG